ncbi:Zn-dependent alcohol dehydrogenase and related dehydrogenase [marine actinobacterium PHSC20C1]|nr:Zn-dependent alcohol dehydrogenase and related dehydrogenase [marine actinobacterium PHSC20C1]
MTNTQSFTEMIERLGADRVIRPSGALPQTAEVLDASGPVRPYEFELEVNRLCLDATSFRTIRAESNGDPEAMGKRVQEIVAARGKMHNPVTDSGGIALGTVRAVGSKFKNPPQIGAQVATLASLTLTPLELDTIVHVDPDSAQIEVRGRAYVCERAPWGLQPADIETGRALEIYDVYGAASHTARLAPKTGVIYVLGCGHAGQVAMAAARDNMDDGIIVAVDVDAASVQRAKDSGLCDIGVVADLQSPLSALAAVQSAGAPPADFTVLVVNAPRCEAFAILATKEKGTVLFFSMATNFSTAALTADGMGHDVTMLIGSGYTPDVGSYALDLYRNTPGLQSISLTGGKA